MANYKADFSDACFRVKTCKYLSLTLPYKLTVLVKTLRSLLMAFNMKTYTQEAPEILDYMA